jgi:uncharacterized protein (TIGR02996 family)
MSQGTTSNPVPPMEVFAEFLEGLSQTITPYDHINPVLRGSVLMSHWFGELARPAADIDLEWFPSPERPTRSTSPIEHARRLCMFAVSDQPPAPIEFDSNTPIPGDGASLWDYSTPGVRCYSGWSWEDRNLRGILQVDVAQAGSYELPGISPESVTLNRASGESVSFPAYSKEMLLAAKLSWILRSLQRKTSPDGTEMLVFSGEPKDLFDAHLLVTRGQPRPDVFQNAFLCVAMEDNLDWQELDLLLNQDLCVPEDEWSQRWPAFDEIHHRLLQERPGTMLQTVGAAVRQLLGSLREHLPFLQSVREDPIDEVPYQIYADWLEDHSDGRAEFLRAYCRFDFHGDESDQERLAGMLSEQSIGWLYHVFENPQRLSVLRKRLEPPSNDSQDESSSPPQTKPWWKFW